MSASNELLKTPLLCRGRSVTWPLSSDLFVTPTSCSKKKSASNNKGPNAPSITFADVAGVDVAKMELLETVACLKDASVRPLLCSRLLPAASPLPEQVSSPCLGAPF